MKLSREWIFIILGIVLMSSCFIVNWLGGNKDLSIALFLAGFVSVISIQF